MTAKSRILDVYDDNQFDLRFTLRLALVNRGRAYTKTGPFILRSGPRIFFKSA